MRVCDGDLCFCGTLFARLFAPRRSSAGLALPALNPSTRTLTPEFLLPTRQPKGGGGVPRVANHPLRDWEFSVRLLFAGHLLFFMLALTISPKFVLATSKSSAPQGGGADPPPPPLAPLPPPRSLKGTLPNPAPDPDPWPDGELCALEHRRDRSCTRSPTSRCSTNVEQAL